MKYLLPAATVLTFAVLLSRHAARRGALESRLERFSATCSFERIDAVGGAPASYESREGPCSAPPGPALARILP